MYPEYPFKKPTLRNLIMLEGRSVYNESGMVRIVRSLDDLCNYIDSSNSLCFVTCLLDDFSFPFLAESVTNSRCKVLCSKLGVPFAIRVRGHSNSSRWIIEGNSWKWEDKEVEVSPQFLKDMWDLYIYVGVGMFPTPSSLGKALMRKIHEEHSLQRQTAISLAAENYLHKHSVGGIINSPGTGNHYDELAKIDMASAYLSQYTKHPVGSAVSFGYGNCNSFATFFAKCDVEIVSELALGPFPVKVRGKNGSRKIVYPTLPGRYQSYLWRESVEDAERVGCRVIVRDGIGFTQFSDYNEIWALYAYWLRKGAPSSFAEKQLKRCAVSAIGSHSQRRNHYFLVEEKDAIESDIPLIGINGDPLRIFIREEYDYSSALMVHWNKYTVNQCNRETYRFALPFANEGRLVQMYVDSVLAIDSGGSYIRRHSNESLRCEPGTWLLEWRHNVDVIENGYTSDEEDRLPGVKKDDKRRGQRTKNIEWSIV